MADKKGPPILGGTDKFKQHIRRIVSSVEYIISTPYVDFSHSERLFAKLCPTIAWHISNILIYGPLSDVAYAPKLKEVKRIISDAIQDVVEQSTLEEAARSGPVSRYITAIERLATQFASSDKAPDAEYLTLEYTVLRHYDTPRSAWSKNEELNKLVFLTSSSALVAKVFHANFQAFEEKYIKYSFRSSIEESGKLGKGYFPKEKDEY